MRRDDTDKNSAERSPESQHEVKGREMRGAGLQPAEFAMTEQAAHEEPTAEQWHADLDRLHRSRIVDGVTDGSECNGKQPHPDRSRIKAAPAKRQREGQQIKRKRKHP